MLTYINNKFVNSSLKNKVELYFLPLMIIYLLYYFSSSLFVVEKPFVVKNKINLEEYKNKKFQGSFLDFFSNIEDNAKQNNIQILSLNNKKNIVELKIQSPKEKLPLFIKQIENINKFTKITFITMYDKKDSNKYLFDLKIDLNKFYIKRIEKEKIISQKILPKPEEIKTKKIEIAKDNYELKAIIAEYVLVNDIWLKQGEDINGFKVDEIKRNSIVLQNINNDKKIRLELADEEYLENIY
jgi:hypothetical protein